MGIRFPGKGRRFSPYEGYNKDGSKMEFMEQIEVVNWLKENHPDVLFTASVGGVRLHPVTAKRMVAMGYSAGTPDLILFQACGSFHGLCIEMKRIGKFNVSPDQVEWHGKLKERGYAVAVCNGAEHAIKTIGEYLKGE